MHRVVLVAILSMSVLLVASVAYAAYTDTTQALYAKFTQLEQQFRLPVGYLPALANAESGMNAKAGSPAHAYGLFQWMPDSWTKFTRQIYGKAKDPGTRSNPYLSAEVTAARAKGAWDTFKGTIQQAKLEPKLGISMEHFLGPGDFPIFMASYMQNPNGRAADVVSKAAKYNPPLFNKGSATFTDVLNNRAKTMDIAGVIPLTGYRPTFTDASQRERILDEQSMEDLERNYKGGPLSPDPIPTSPTDYGIPPRNTQTLNDQRPKSTICVETVYCFGTALVEQSSSCAVHVVEQCEDGCANGQCLRPQPCPQDTVTYNDQCLCPAGSAMQSGQCVRLSPQQAQQNQQLSSDLNSGEQRQPASQQSSGGGASGGGQAPTTKISPFNSISNILRPEKTQLPKPNEGAPVYTSIPSISDAKLSRTIRDANAWRRGGVQDISVVAPRTNNNVTGGIPTFTSKDLRNYPNVARPNERNDSQGIFAEALSKLKNLLFGIIAFVTPR
mgnify:FL=1